MTPKISIITPTFNAAIHLYLCIESVASQTYKNIEHLIIDGLSTDNTIEIVKEYAQKYPYIRYVSEKDAGIYDAMNKGIEMARGEWLYFLGADDVIYDENVLQHIFAHKLYPNVGLIIGNVFFESTKRLCSYQNTKFDKYYMIVNSICHQAFFTHKQVFEKIGLFDISYKICADNRFFYEALQQNTAYEYVDVTIANFSGMGISSIVKSRGIITQERLKTIAQIYKHNQHSHLNVLKPYIKDFIEKTWLIEVLAYGVPFYPIYTQIKSIDNQYPKLIHKVLLDRKFWRENSTEAGGYDNLNFGNLILGLKQIWIVCQKDKKYFYHLKNTIYWLVKRMKRKSSI